MSYQDPTVSNANYLRQPLYQPEGYSEQYQPSAPPEPTPPHAAASAPSSGKFTTQGYRDLVWAVLFLVHVVAYLGAGGFVLHRYADELTMGTNSTSNATAPAASLTYIINPSLYSSSYDPSLTSDGSALTSSSLYTATSSNMTTATSTDDHIRLQRDSIFLGFSSLAVSALIAILWLSLTKSYARTMIYAALVADIAVSILMVFICLMYGAIVGVVLFAVFAGLKALWVYWMRSRIAFAAVILEHAVLCIQLWPATVAAALLSLLVQAMWIVGWSFATVGFYYAATRVSGADSSSRAVNADGTQGQMQQDSTLSYVVVFLTLVSFYWTSQVVKNTLHVTVAGVASTWYFLHPQATPANPTAASMKRALSTSFGSICLGSLVLSVVRAMRVVVNMMANQPGNPRNGGAAVMRAVCYCLAQCLLSILDRVVNFVNKFAYSYVAIYGVSYCEAAGSVWELLKARGFDMLINDSLIGIALGFACLMGGLSSAAVCGVMSHVLFTSSGVWWVWALIGFVMGFAMTMVATEVVDSAVTALFVCLADDPAALQRTKPDEYAKLVPAIQARYPAISFVAF